MAGSTVFLSRLDTNANSIDSSIISIMANFNWYCASANSTTGTFYVQLTVRRKPNAAGDTGSVAFTLQDKTSSSSKSITLTIPSQAGTSTVSNSGTFTCTRNTDAFILTQSAGSIIFLTSQVSINRQIYWSDDSGGGGGGGSSTTSYNDVWLGCSVNPFGDTSVYATINGQMTGTQTIGYLTDGGTDSTYISNEGTSYPLTDYIKYSNQAKTNTISIGYNGDPTKVRYQGKTFTATPRNSNYRFVGWNQHQWSQPLSNWGLANGATLYVTAYFEGIPTYTITYNANGGSGAPSSQTKKEATTLTLSTQKPTRTGYYFAGWSSLQSATEPDYAAGESFTADQNTTLYAVWWKCAYIYSSGWKPAIPYIYNGEWKRTEPYVYSSGWK